MNPGGLSDPGVPYPPERLSNRLIHEKSPYLLQHSHNPVDWYPWGEEAFNRAASEDRPVFLSIGYSTCHWCHVMAKESFEDTNVASILNREFVSIKVDREERPDIDSIYMEICQRMTGRGGWPLTIVLTPEKKPFFAGTYFPSVSRSGIVGISEILLRISELWHGQRGDLYSTADEIIRLASPESINLGEDPDQRMLDAGFRDLATHFDRKNGGFGSAPKFPAPHMLVFLIRYWYLTGQTRALTMAEQTLNAIRSGGIWDQIGSGLYRYATDAQWRVPHFEKMLSDQALFVIACTEAYEATRKVCYQNIANECVNYVLRELQDPGGAFYTAEDADSPDGEGAYYTWTQEEIVRVLGPEDAERFFSVFTLTSVADNNTGDDEVPENECRCILSVSAEDMALAKTLDIAPEAFSAQRDALRSRLLSARQERPRPGRDTKILTDCNALFCKALAQAGRAFNNPSYIDAASRALRFIQLYLFDDNGSLLHRYYEGKSGILAFADDYVHLISACIEMYRSTFEIAYLKNALDLNTHLRLHFHDTDNGGFFTISDTVTDLPVRRKEWYDGSVPSANAVAFENSMQLARFTADPDLEKMGQSCARFVAGSADRTPSAVTGFLAALSCFPRIKGVWDIVISGNPSDERTRALVDELRSRYLPDLIVLLRPPGKAGNDVDTVVPLARGRVFGDSIATAYLCSSSECLPPVHEPPELRRLLDKEMDAGP